MTDFLEDRSRASEPAELAIEEVRLLVDEGREQGYLASDHIADVLQDVELTPDQIDGIYNLFADLGIDILEGETSGGVEGGDAKPEEGGHHQARPLREVLDQRPGPNVPQGDRQSAAAHG